MTLALARTMAVTALVSGAGAVAAASLAPIDAPPRAPARSRPGEPAFQRRYAADSLGRLVTTRDLFRLGRRPADAVFDPERAAAAGTEEPDGPAKPVLRLVGLIRGLPPAAIVEGFPGVEGGRVLRAGDTVGTLRVVSITPASVRIAGMDTTWTLVMRVR